MSDEFDEEDDEFASSKARDSAEAPSRDSEIDFDDESDEDLGPMDLVEAAEAEALLDDPEQIEEES